MGTADDLIALAIDAAGGSERWESAAEAVWDMRSGGRAFEMRLKPRAMRDVKGTVTIAEPRTVYSPYPMAGQRGVFEADRVRIETDAGEVVAERAAPREAFAGLSGARRNLWWDHLDLLYFAGYALWNYASFPFMLARPGFEATEGEPARAGRETWRRLDVTFPEGFPTHSPEQSFFLDEAGHLRRLDYTALPFGRWAQATHLCEEHRSFDGLTVPTRRRVYPRLPGGRPFRPLNLVWIDVLGVELR